MDNTKKAKRKDIRRRALAALCAITIAVLQCAVILTIDSESAYGAENLMLTAKGPGGLERSEGYSKSKISWDTKIPDEATGTELDAITVEKFVKSKNISPENISNWSVDKGDYIATDGSDYYVFSKSDGAWTNKGTVPDANITVTMKDNYKPAKSISISPSNFELDPDKQETVTLNASVTPRDSFFTEEDVKGAVSVEWECVGPGNCTPSGYSATVTATGEGSINVSAKIVGDPSTKSSISGTGKKVPPETKPTDPTTTKPATDPKDLRTATVKTDGKLVKGKAYTNSEMKSHLTLTDSNGKTIDKKYWEVISVSRDGNDYEVTIKASKAGKEKGYFDIKETTVKATKTATTTKYKYTTRKYSGGGVTRSTRINVTGGETTSSLPPTVTYAPDRTITVKEVFLGSKIEDDQQESQNPWDDSNDDWNDDSSDDWTETEMQEEISLDFGPAVGSAAVAAAACGAGMVGRIRRFHVDTRAADAAASQTGKTKKLKLKK